MTVLVKAISKPAIEEFIEDKFFEDDPKEDIDEKIEEIVNEEELAEEGGETVPTGDEEDGE